MPEEADRGAALLGEVSQDTSGMAGRRARAWMCNVLARRHRQAGEYVRAAAYALEAIRIGEELGDRYVTAINRMNLGNAYRDEKEYEKALEQYERAAREAAAAGYRDVEAASERLAAGVHRGRNDPQRALHHGVYAAGLVRGTAARGTYADAQEEIGRAYEALRDTKKAAAAYIDGAVAIAQEEGLRHQFYELALDALFLLAERNAVADFCDAVGRLFGEPPQADETSGIAQRLLAQVPYIVAKCDAEHLVPALGLHCRLLFENTPDPLARHVFRETARKLLSVPVQGSSTSSIAIGMIPLATAVPLRVLHLGDLVTVAEDLTKRVPGISFRPASDGAGNWVVAVDLGKPIICSFVQLDDRVDVGVVTMILALFLKGYEMDIQQRVVMSRQFPRNEVAVKVGNVSELINALGDTTLRLAQPMEQVCSVTRPTDPVSDERVPTIVVCRDDMEDKWTVGHRRGGSLQIICGLTLIEILYQLFDGQVDQESLRPKVVSVVRQTLS